MTTMTAGIEQTHIFSPMLHAAERGLQQMLEAWAHKRTKAILSGLEDTQLVDIGAGHIAEDRQQHTPIDARTMTYLMSLR